MLTMMRAKVLTTQYNISSQTFICFGIECDGSSPNIHNPQVKTKQAALPKLPSALTIAAL